jgi:hypothetical protein
VAYVNLYRRQQGAARDDDTDDPDEPPFPG